jgi:hypothetical protein
MAVIGLLAVGPFVRAEDGESATYKGTWVNRKMRSSGPLTCIMEQGEVGTEWKARFEGTFKNDPFKYDVTFDSAEGKGKTDLKGKANVDGDEYEWTGTLKGDVLTIKYRSGRGYNGEFAMKKQKPPAAKKKKS